MRAVGSASALARCVLRTSIIAGVLVAMPVRASRVVGVGLV